MCLELQTDLARFFSPGLQFLAEVKVFRTDFPGLKFGYVMQ